MSKDSDKKGSIPWSAVEDDEATVILPAGKPPVAGGGDGAAGTKASAKGKRSRGKVTAGKSKPAPATASSSREGEVGDRLVTSPGSLPGGSSVAARETPALGTGIGEDFSPGLSPPEPIGKGGGSPYDWGFEEDPAVVAADRSDLPAPEISVSPTASFPSFSGGDSGGPRWGDADPSPVASGESDAVSASLLGDGATVTTGGDKPRAASLSFPTLSLAPIDDEEDEATVMHAPATEATPAVRDDDDDAATVMHAPATEATPAVRDDDDDATTVMHAPAAKATPVVHDDDDAATVMHAPAARVALPALDYDNAAATVPGVPGARAATSARREDGGGGRLGRHLGPVVPHRSMTMRMRQRR
ncbi:MAG: hypothetical protein HQL59_09135 [Magnetococcales bacterium]|nr:hypothetical protein [Magnetococcales bacterium]